MKKITQLICTALIGGLAFSAQAGPRLDKIQESQTLRVGTPGDYRPFAMKTDQGYEGHDIDVIEAMANELGLTVEYIPTSWPNLMNDLQADKFDIAVGGITRNPARMAKVEMLPGYAPFGKVALARASEKNKYQSVEDLNQSSVHVIKNPGGTNEIFVLENLKNAQVSTHPHNAEIPALIAEGKGDIMITETYEALHYSKTNPQLAALFIEEPLTPKNFLGFMLPTDDADYLRMMQFIWNLMDEREILETAEDKWLQ